MPLGRNCLYARKRWLCKHDRLVIDGIPHATKIFTVSTVGVFPDKIHSLSWIDLLLKAFDYISYTTSKREFKTGKSLAGSDFTDDSSRQSFLNFL